MGYLIPKRTGRLTVGRNITLILTLSEVCKELTAQVEGWQLEVSPARKPAVDPSTD
jgi:hypothetical protein